MVAGLADEPSEFQGNMAVIQIQLCNPPTPFTRSAWWRRFVFLVKSRQDLSMLGFARPAHVVHVLLTSASFHHPCVAAIMLCEAISTLVTS